MFALSFFYFLIRSYRESFSMQVLLFQHLAHMRAADKDLFKKMFF